MGTRSIVPTHDTLPIRETDAVIELVPLASDQTVGEFIDRVHANAAVSVLCIYITGSICDLSVSRADNVPLIYQHRRTDDRLIWQRHSIQVETFKIRQMEECIDVQQMRSI